MATTLKTAYAVCPSVKLKGFKKDKKTGVLKFGILKELLFGDYIKPYFKGTSYETKNVIEREISNLCQSKDARYRWISKGR